jgi:hypothetical protein
MEAPDGLEPIQRDKGAAKPPAKACLLKKLRQEYEDMQQAYNRLKQENTSLRTREVMLLESAV